MTADKSGAFAVHILTASGAALALLALMAAVSHAWALMFLWLGIALVVDGIDGPLARRLDVVGKLPRWSGETLDLVVDFVTYVFVPAFAIAASGLMPFYLGIATGVVVTVTGALYFADRNMKLADNSFRGFPALWNCAAFYLILLAPPAWLCAAIVAALAVLSFANFPFVHPVRVVRLRPLTLALLAAWGVLALVALSRDMTPGFWVTIALCVIALYVIAVGLLRPKP